MSAAFLTAGVCAVSWAMSHIGPSSVIAGFIGGALLGVHVVIERDRK